MIIEGRKIWQVAAGDTDRNYAQFLLDWDVIAMGPGDFGKWPECEDGFNKSGLSPKKINDIRKFCDEIKSDDLIILRVGTTDIYGIGVVVGDECEWFDDFGDIDGWDLQFIRRVRWVWQPKRGVEKLKVYSLKWGATVHTVENPDIQAWVEKIDVPSNELNRKIVNLPVSCKNNQKIPIVDIQEISDSLFDRGVAANAIETLVHQMDDLVRIAKWYQRSSVKPSEEETRAYLVVPLLRTLGWTPQKMAVEWNNVDVALFSALPREDSHLEAVVEVKTKDLSCLSAKSQAQGYAERQNRKSCRRLVVTDGIKYAIYSRQSDGSFVNHPQAYMNLTRLVSDYPILKCEGAQKCLELMATN